MIRHSNVQRRLKTDGQTAQLQCYLSAVHSSITSGFSTVTFNVNFRNGIANYALRETVKILRLSILHLSDRTG